MKKYTQSAKQSDNPGKWVVVDAQDMVLGRLATAVAARLRGKHNVLFTPHVDTGDFVIVINADKVQLTGKKWDKKCYYHHSGFMGGLKVTTAKNLIQKKPEDLVRFAVKGMLPKNSLGRKLMTKLKIYTSDKHPHEAQQPEPLKISL